MTLWDRSFNLPYIQPTNKSHQFYLSYTDCIFPSTLPYSSVSWPLQKPHQLGSAITQALSHTTVFCTEVSCLADLTRSNTCACHLLNYDLALTFCSLKGRSNSLTQSGTTFPALPITSPQYFTHIYYSPCCQTQGHIKAFHSGLVRRLASQIDAGHRLVQGPGSTIPCQLLTLHAARWKGSLGEGLGQWRTSKVQSRRHLPPVLRNFIILV